MASKLNAFLNQLGSGFLRPKGQMGDWQHAARTFVDDNFRLAPKAKFLFHVYFDINPGAILIPTLKERHKTELGRLVKSVDLPRFNVKTQTLNQYNRKKIVQTTHEYQPMTFKFHDDRSDIVNMMWQAYYKWYYADAITAEPTHQAYTRNAYKGYDYIRGPFGLDNNSRWPFFNSIYIYQINQRNFLSYQLINPVITSFGHDQVSYSDQGSVGAENQMTVSFEAVTYDSGVVSSGKIKGFAQDHYDKSPSPLSPFGGGTTSVLGPGGVLDGASTVLSALAKGRDPGGAFNSLENLVNTAAAAVNTYQNTKNISKAGARTEATNLLAGAAVAGAATIIGGIKGTAFPSASSAPSQTATRRDDLGGG